MLSDGGRACYSFRWPADRPDRRKRPTRAKQMALRRCTEAYTARATATTARNDNHATHNTKRSSNVAQDRVNDTQHRIRYQVARTDSPSASWKYEEAMGGQTAKPKEPTETTSTEEAEASRNAALRAGVHLVDVVEPTTMLLVAAPVMTCLPVMASAQINCDGQQCDTTQLKEAAAFPGGLTPREPPTGGGHPMASPPMRLTAMEQ